MNPPVKAVIPRDDYTLEITFTNGEVGVFDCARLLSHGVFQELQDVGYFKQARVEGGTVVWPHEQDICPDTLYEDSAKVASVATPGEMRQAGGPARPCSPDQPGGGGYFSSRM